MKCPQCGKHFNATMDDVEVRMVHVTPHEQALKINFTCPLCGHGYHIDVDLNDEKVEYRKSAFPLLHFMT